MTYAAEVLADAPTHWWRLNEDAGMLAFDSGASRLTLSESFNALPVAFGYGGVASDGGSWYGRNTNTIGTPVVGNFLPAPYTLELWLYPRLITQIQVMACQGVITNESWDLETTAANVVRFQDVHSNVPTIVTAGSALPAEAWAHLVATHDSTNLRLYQNGALQATAACVPHTSPANAMTLGGMIGGTGFRTFGFLAEVAIYPTALSLARIGAHYAAADRRTLTPGYRGWAGAAALDVAAADLALILSSVRRTYP